MPRSSWNSQKASNGSSDEMPPLLTRRWLPPGEDMFALIIRGGDVIDGTGAPSRRGDVGVRDDRIAAVEPTLDAEAGENSDASGRIVTPGFVDVHSHYDGQMTWDELLEPSTCHGVTTLITGNCGVGFAPVRPDRHRHLIELMEGVEDIPGSFDVHPLLRADVTSRTESAMKNDVTTFHCLHHRCRIEKVAVDDGNREAGKSRSSRQIPGQCADLSGPIEHDSLTKTPANESGGSGHQDAGVVELLHSGNGPGSGHA